MREKALLRKAILILVIATSCGVLARPTLGQTIETFCGISGLQEDVVTDQSPLCWSDLVVRLTGEIQPDLSRRLAATLIRVRPHVGKNLLGFDNQIILELSSPGGNIRSAMETGRVIRDARLLTRMYDACASACSLLFIAGSTRLMMDGQWLELHRPSLPSESLSALGYTDIQKANTELRDSMDAYVREMGISSTFLDVTYSVPIDTSVELNSFDARDMGVVGMSPSEFDTQKGQFISRLGPVGDEALAFYIGKHQEIRACLKRQYQRLIGRGTDATTASYLASDEGLDGCTQEAERIKFTRVRQYEIGSRIQNTLNDVDLVNFAEML